MILFMKDFSRQLDECADLQSLFMLVQGAVEGVLRIRRDDILIRFTNLPHYIGGFHPIGSNVIGINKNFLMAVNEKCGKKIAKACLFHVLLHEYIHSIGFFDESRTDFFVYEISKKLLGETHPSTFMAKYGVASVFYMKDKKKGKEVKIDITFYG